MIQQNRLSNKFIVFFCAMFLIFIIACNTASQSASHLPASTFDSNSIGTIVVKTANAAITQTAEHVTLTVTPTPTTTLTPSTSSDSFRPGDPTATPLGNDITEPNFITGIDAYNNAHDYEKVVTLMSSVISTNPNLAPPYRYRGLSYWYLGKCNESLADFEQALSLNPNYAAAWAGHGLASQCLGNETQEILDYQKALSIDPSLAFVHHNLGAYYWGQKDYEKSLEEYTLSVSIDPNRAGSWSGKAEALFKLGKDQECIFSTNKAIAVNPEEWLAYSDRAICELFMENYTDALQDYQTFVDNANADAVAETWNNLGIAQNKTGDYEGAIISYTQALKLDPSYYFSYAGRADSYYELKEYNKAIEDYKKTTNLNPVNAHAYCYLSLSYFEVQKYQDSIDAIEASHEIDPNCGGQKLHETEARSYYALGNYDQALVFMNKALAMSNYSFGHYYRGIIYQAAGKNQEAIQDLELFLSLVQSPESYPDEITDAKARLAQLKK